MSATKPIKSALVSVFHKDGGLDQILNLLAKDGVRLISTGGTHKYIQELGLPCETVESLTGYPSILGGRVKTLHPSVMGGILARRDNPSDNEESQKYAIPAIDLVIVDLYPFVETVAAGGSEAEIIEKIDIGGISLIRAAAKNFNDVAIVASKAQYGTLKGILEEQGAQTTLEQRRDFARDAFAVSSGYDSAIYRWFAGENPESLRIAIDGSMPLRYGENPHQKARFYGNLDEVFTKLHGKEISYNNLLDIDAALRLIAEFEQPTFAVLKHNNACGLATRQDILSAWEAALACDPLSAFGGILVANRPIDANTAEKINEIFFEVVIAPEFSADALTILESKKNRIILRLHEAKLPAVSYRSAVNGILAQDVDLKTETASDLNIVTTLKPSREQIDDMLFANKIVKASKSNSIVLAKNGTLLASGVGQTSRVDSLKQAIAKARSFGFDLTGASMASDAFFPFADCVEIAKEAGIECVIHPGGSIRDKDSIDYCENHGMIMAITGTRHFRH